MNPASRKQLRRLALDLGPLVIFFAAFKFANIYVATGLFMAAVLVSLAVGYWIERKISPMPAFTAVLVLVFGGLTLYLHNDVFIKVKLTILYTFFFLFVYLLLYAFSHLLQEHSVRGPDSPAAVAATPASHAQQE